MGSATLDGAALEKLISAAVAAPSIHNTQPWRYRLDPDTMTLKVLADPSRGLAHTDPSMRALHLSIGASVFNLRVAAAHLGWLPVVRLLPNPKEPDLLASLRLAGSGHASVAEHRPDLYSAIWRRHTSRLPFHGGRVATAVVDEMVQAARAENAALHVPDNEHEVRRLLLLTARAEQRNAADPGKRAETRNWVLDARGGDAGLPGAALGAWDVTGRIPMRKWEFPCPPQAPRQFPAVFEEHPTIAVLSTAHDTPVDWLRAGQALEHVLLLATARGLRASLLHQAVEWPDLRRALAGDNGQGGHVHLLLRLGHGPAGAATPRRAASAVLENGESAGGPGRTAVTR